MNTLSSAMGAAAEEAAVLEVGSRLELFVDGYLIDSLQGTRLKLHIPIPREVAIQFDAPWEGPGSGYVTVMKDKDRYRMYYRGKSKGKDGEGEVTCYAESKDGITWTKPSLGICGFQGSTDNNIIWTGFGTHCFMAFKDMNPEALQEERYKAIASGPPWRIKRIIALASPDGIHWSKIQEEPIITQEATDWGADLAFWDTEQGQYVAYLRAWRTPASREAVPLKEEWQVARRDAIISGGKLFRQIVRCTSPDFIHWTEPKFIDLGDTPLEHLYTNATTPYFRAPHIYLAFPRRFVLDRKYEEHPYPGVSDAVFMSSRDGVHFDRTFMEAFVRRGLDPKNWTDRDGTPAWGVVPTGPEEISLYLSEHLRYPTHRLRRFTLRTDGFVSVHADYDGGEFVTKPLAFEGRELVINYSTSAVGSVKVEVQGAKGEPVPGYTLQDSAEIYGDEIEHAVGWKEGGDLSHLAGQPVRLRFVMKDADLYSICFR